MADILFKCSECGKHLAIDERGVGLTINCPDCGASLVVPDKNTIVDQSEQQNPVEAPPESAGRPPERPKLQLKRDSEAPETKACPYCAEEILSTAIKCRHCGEMLDGGPSSAFFPQANATRPIAQPTMDRPQPVNTAIALLIGGVVLGLLNLAVSWPSLSSDIPILFARSFIVIFVLILCAGQLLFVYLLATGRGWGRILLLVLTGVGLPLSVSSLIQTTGSNPLAGLLELAGLVIGVVAAALTFTRPANAWFAYCKWRNSSGRIGGGLMEVPNSLAVWSMFFGVFGLGTLICSVPAVILGHRARGQIKRGESTTAGDGYAVAGLVTGYLSLGILFLAMAFAAVITPTVKGALERSKALAEDETAANEVKSLAIAVKAYFNEYARLPVASSEQDVADRLYQGAQSEFVMQVLAGQNGDLNPKRTDFFSLPEAGTAGQIQDPWGAQYLLMMDNDYDGAVDCGGERIQGPCAVWSSGPNGLNEFGKGDDICSWTESEIVAEESAKGSRGGVAPKSASGQSRSPSLSPTGATPEKESGATTPDEFAKVESKFQSLLYPDSGAPVLMGDIFEVLLMLRRYQEEHRGDTHAARVSAMIEDARRMAAEDNTVVYEREGDPIGGFSPIVSEEQVELLDKRSQMGDGEAAYRLAEHYGDISKDFLMGSVDYDPAKATKYIRRSAQLGHPHAEFLLGAYLAGTAPNWWSSVSYLSSTTARNRAEGIRLIQSSARKGIGVADEALASMGLTGGRN